MRLSHLLAKNLTYFCLILDFLKTTISPTITQARNIYVSMLGYFCKTMLSKILFYGWCL